MMAVLTVRNVPPEVHRRLRLRAARAKRSVEAEVRAILAETCREEAPPLTGGALQAWVAGLYHGEPPQGAVDELISDRRTEGRRE